ncbi:restriction endonuclease subunit S [Vibrio brasiliensis]|uniref:restriction endonuclease subunit S n=1 Tax=Vibrio brasiliensis TaxID=170652 RepID=UPI001EFC4091|nr:restriction endonuclease subunit S [Vibrio brasiliensis]MCG9723824.1 restriction endonuclease subunit S [Vibrio brasiliensis]
MSDMTPPLRFKGFTKPVSILKFGDISKVNQGLQIPISERYHEPAENCHFYITNEFLRTNSKKSYYIHNPPSSVICNEEDILMTRTGNTGQVVTDVSGAFHNNFFRIHFDRKRFDKKFLVQYLRTIKTQNHILRLAGTSTIPDLNHSDFYSIPVPKIELEEQQKIADFLTSVDRKIGQLTEKHRLLKEYTKGVMQQIFSQQIRFKDEDGKAFPEWKTYALGQILSLQSDSLNMQDDETYELITVKRGFGGVVSRGLFKGKNVLVKNQFTIHENEFVISKRQIVHGACGLVPPELEGSIVSNEYNIFRPVEDLLDIDYFNRFATTPLMRRAFFINSDGVHIEKLLFKTQSWLKTKVSLPCLKEQQKIAQFLQSIDQKIDAVAEQIEQTKQFKKGLLQQMFV